MTAAGLAVSDVASHPPLVAGPEVPGGGRGDDRLDALAARARDQLVVLLAEAAASDLVVALGGDGTALIALRAAEPVRAPVLAVACGSVGA